MSYGPSAAVRFEVKHGAKGGIFWQKDPSKQKPRKFGYKAKDLRHPIRKPEEEYIEEPVKKTKPSRDFIKQNRERYRPQKKEEENSRAASSAGRPSSQIKPGTVTLTQDQLNALLATVGKLQGDADGLRISIDADSNSLKIESPRKADSVPNSRGSDNGRNRADSDHNEQRSIPGLTVPNGTEQEDKTVEERNKKNVEKGVRFDSARNEVQELKPDSQRPPVPPAAALIPWRHMTVAERKRLQWAREKAAEEAIGTFDPWGRPGAGAPPPKKEEHPQPATEFHTKEEKNLRKAVDEIEAKYRRFLAQDASRDSPATKNTQREPEDDHHEKSGRYSNVSTQKDEPGVHNPQEHISRKQLEDRGNSRPSKKQNRTDEQKEKRGSQKRGDKKQRPGTEEDRHDRKQGTQDNNRERGQGENRRQEEEKKNVISERDFMQLRTETAEAVSKAEKALPASMQTSMHIGQVAPDNSQFLSKKEEEKKRWLEELDRQREEKRLQKQREQEERRAAVDDTWANRFVQQPPPRPSIRMQTQQQPTATQQLLAPDQAPVSTGQAYEARRVEPSFPGGQTNVHTQPGQEMPPAAMRTSMMIGGAAPNDDMIRSRKEEERRQWLEELNKQREEQREARMKLKNQQKGPDDTWADRLSQDSRPAAADRSPRPIPGLEPQPPAAAYQEASSGRVSSAPQPQAPSVNASIGDDTVTFLRGQNVYMDPVTRYELEQKRKKHLEYQAAVKAQIEEKERLKREERERKWREEMEEEAKLKAERDHLQRQLEAEENKHRQKEEARQRQVEQLKHMMDVEQEKAKEERMLNRLTTLQQHGHDIRGLKAHYEATTPRLHGVNIDPATVPGLTGTSPRDDHYSPNPPSYRTGTINVPVSTRAQEISTGPVNHDPYVENRVLTPSRFRKPSQPHSDPMSPRREFATQTDEITALIEGLKKEISDVEIEYRPKADKKPPNKTAQKQTAAQSNNAEKKKPPADNRQKQAAPPAGRQNKQKQLKSDGKPPKWNYQNQQKKAPLKQSEKDPFYEQKRMESEERRAKRERQLQYLVELNKQVIPTEKHSRLDTHTDGEGDHSPPRGQHTDRGTHDPGPRRGRETVTYEDRTIPNGDVSHRSRSPPAKNAGKYRRRDRSPPVPAVRHKAGIDPARDFETDYDVDAHSYWRQTNGEEPTPRVDEHGNVRAPVRDTDFVPIMRTQDILDPSRAEDPVQLSRENTRIEKARKHYFENQKPADFGNQMQMYEDRQRQPRPKDPILNPGLVKDFPTARQDQILQQLSSLKQSLIQRQRELETCMSPSDLEKQV